MHPSVAAWILALSLAGCALERAPVVVAPGTDAPIEPLDADVPLDAPAPQDAGDDDTGAPLIDAGPDDAGASDAGPRDAGAECTGSVARCDVETLVTCVAGRFVYDDCASHGAYCDTGACVTQTCVPGSLTCAGAVETLCDARGASTSLTSCARGCTEPAGCNPVTACTLAVHATVGLGTMRVNTCGQGNQHFHLAGCTRTDTTGSDLIVRLEVPVTADYRIELQVLGSADGVLYMRSACADRATEIDCDDDSATGFGSRIDITLEPGDYFLMLDSFRDGGGADGDCGEMDLVVALL